MKAAPLLVAWHDENAPIYSAHFEPSGKGRLATAGGDHHVRVRPDITQAALAQECLYANDCLALENRLEW